jgi:uncharacterized protein DUF3142
VAVVCLFILYLFSSGSFIVRLGPRLPLSLRRYLLPKPKPSPRMANLPNIYLWAWERPEDLQFLPDKKVGVAFLAKTISLSPPPQPIPSSLNCDSASSAAAALECGSILVRPRLQPLRISPGTPLMAVIRIETSRGALTNADTNSSPSAPAFTKTQLDLTAAEISSAAKITGVSAIQIDFDATLSEHNFYRDLLLEIRKQLPPNFPLSITALASWCIGDRWLTQLPPGTIDEAVPMLFRMGAGTREVTTYLAHGRDFSVSACSTSLGLSTDEPFSRDILSGKLSVSDAPLSSLRIYVFSPHLWEKAPTDQALKDFPSWHEN